MASFYGIWPCREWPGDIEPVPHCSMPILFKQQHGGYMTAILLPHNCGILWGHPTTKNLALMMLQCLLKSYMNTLNATHGTIITGPASARLG